MAVWNLRMVNDFSDEAGMALVEALSVNKTLRNITLSLDPLRPGWQVQDTDFLSASICEAFSAMLRVNTSPVVLKIILPFESTGADERLVNARNQMRFEQRLNEAGRGSLLSSSETTREDGVDTLNELNYSNIDESPEFNVSCLYSLLRLNPATCM
jgi:hypothetical protein